MSSTLQKEFENKLVVALKDARVRALQNGMKGTENELYDAAEIALIDFRLAMDKNDMRRQRELSTKVIALLLNYQIKFL